ncbi:hypothetical protein [Variovorax sp. 160MFSha2.1]|uniref:hypothetical protein n=1 Tax=Variovorax sp. 160MFSha2.1 TaxID=3158367 RepID=UPI003AAE046C
MNIYQKIGKTICIGLAGVLLGCASGRSWLAGEAPPPKVQTTEDLLSALKDGLDQGVLGNPEFYWRRIGYKFTRFPINRNDPSEFGYGTGEAIKMDEGAFGGSMAGLNKRDVDKKRKVISVGFPAPGCTEYERVEEIFMQPFKYVPENILFAARPIDWPGQYRISKIYKNSEQSITLYIGGSTGCLQRIEATEIFNQE